MRVEVQRQFSPVSVVFEHPAEKDNMVQLLAWAERHGQMGSLDEELLSLCRDLKFRLEITHG